MNKNNFYNPKTGKEYNLVIGKYSGRYEDGEMRYYYKGDLLADEDGPLRPISKTNKPEIAAIRTPTKNR